MLKFQTRQVEKVGQVVDVFLDSKLVGAIHRVPGGYQYQPKGARKDQSGEILHSVNAVMRSLQSED